MAALVVVERYLWYNLSGIKDRDRTFLIDAPLSSSGLFGNSINSVVERFQEAKCQSNSEFKSLRGS